MFKIGDKVKTSKMLLGNSFDEIGVIVDFYEFSVVVKFENFFWNLSRSDIIKVQD